ncbi:MAG TPA: PAS domain-containing sensor histidine kinase [Acidimicrobiia bacterium]|jgi:signal transduction histidine kinase|nr:PAS domain-containing sensor histidine kinase [Acidimicrobiia bacterium]
MARSASQSILAERSQLNRVIVRVGAASAWFVAALYLVAGVLSGDRDLFLEAVGPVLAATLMTLQIIFGREDGGVALFGSGVVIVVWYTMLGDPGTIVPASVALVLIASLGMLFASTYRTVIAGTVAAILFALPWLWSLPVAERIALGGVLALSFVMTHLILSAIQTGTTSVMAGYRVLFEEAPTAALEEDWSEAMEYVRSEYTGKPERIRQFLLAYPTVVKKAVSLAKVLRANDAALDLIGVTDRERFLGYRSPNAVTEENLGDWVAAIVSLYNREKAWEGEIVMRTRTGELSWLQTRTVDTSADGSASTVVIGLADITHVKARNEAMAQLVKAKDEFIASISHELRTPLTAVIGLTSELVADDQLTDGERAELLEMAAGQAMDMANIVEDLLVAARAEMGTIVIEPVPVDLVDESRAVLSGMGMSVELPEESPPVVLADPIRVRQILRNLFTNAQRYGGPRRRVVSGANGRSAWLEIRDNGAGIPEERASTIFDPYVTGTAGVQGSVGLGLAVARQLAELMRGSLVYERNAGETVFRLKLPIASGAESISPSHSNER